MFLPRNVNPHRIGSPLSVAPTGNICYGRDMRVQKTKPHVGHDTQVIHTRLAKTILREIEDQPLFLANNSRFIGELVTLGWDVWKKKNLPRPAK